jgi:hypothetical protein
LLIYAIVGFMPNRENLSVTDYLGTANREILRTGRYPFSCGIVAIDIAKILLDEDERPKIVGMKGSSVDLSGDTRPIVPKVFKRPVSWGTHLVCVHEGLALDPIVGEPMEFEAYLEEAFTERPAATRIFHYEELGQLIAARADMLRDVREGAPFVVLSDVSQLRDGEWPPLER